MIVPDKKRSTDYESGLALVISGFGVMLYMEYIPCESILTISDLFH